MLRSVPNGVWSFFFVILRQEEFDALKPYLREAYELSVSDPKPV